MLLYSILRVVYCILIIMLLYSILQEKSGTLLVAQEKFSEPKEVEVLFNVDLLATFYTTIRSRSSSLIDLVCELFQKLVINPVKKELGLAFKGNQKKVVEALEVICVVTILVFRTVTRKLLLALLLRDGIFSGRQ